MITGFSCQHFIRLAAAIDGVTGKPSDWRRKSYLSGICTNNGFVNRGVAYWTDGKNERIFLGTGDANLVALDAKTGKP
jgi:quinoprotein glucose dehydrogenase